MRSHSEITARRSYRHAERPRLHRFCELMSAAPSPTKRSRTGHAATVPPSDGWRLTEAVDALCLEEAKLYRDGGPELRAAVEKDLRGLRVPHIRSPENRAEDWLSRCVILALGKRPDLLLSGRNSLKPAWEPRVPVPRDVLESACRWWSGATGEDGWWIILEFQRQVAWIRSYLPDGTSAPVSPSDLVSVRVETSGKPLPGPSEQELSEFFETRRSRLPEGASPPNEAECLREAETYFGCQIARDRFRAIRRRAIPEWTKRGPRGPRHFTKSRGK